MIKRWLILAMICGASLATHAQKPQLTDILKAAGDYLVQYAAKLSPVIAEEDYIQRDLTTPAVHRRLTSDLLLIGGENGTVTGFRDVFAVDSHNIRPRDDRLLNLFVNRKGDVSDHMRAIEDEGARYYISPNLRVLDMPALPLELLRQEAQNDSTFALDGMKTMDGVQVAIVRFSARTAGRLVNAPDGARTSGRFWIEAGTGTVRQTELTIEEKGYRFRVTTKYARDKTLDLWVPAETFQDTDMTSPSRGLSHMGAGGNIGQRQSLEGRAKYSKYRTGR